MVSSAFLLFLVLPIAYAAGGGGGGGGGGGSSSGLGFGSRDSVLILVSQDYSEKFSLKNGTKYDLKVNVEDNNVSVTFGSIKFELEVGDNYIDLNNNNLADINFNLISISGKRADIRIINVKESVAVVSKESETITEHLPEEQAREQKEPKEKETGLKCGNLPTLRERVSCRLDLEEEEQEEELKLYYLPEECRILNGSDRGLCIASYKSVQTCWKFPAGNERISCVKRVIKLESLQEQKEICNSKIGYEKNQCKEELKNKGYSLIKWHFYNLEEKAEDFMQRGLIDKESVVDFISKTEQNKIKFNDAETKEERKDIILAVKEDWKEFADKVRENLKV